MKTTRIPIASHGMHKHPFNFPLVGTSNFQEIFPIFTEWLRDGEKINLKTALFSRLNPLVNPAFVTGRYNIKAFFAPHRYVYKPWYNFDSGTAYTDAQGSSYIPNKAPYVHMNRLSQAFLAVNDFTTAGSATNRDIVYSYNDNNQTPNDYYVLTNRGARVLKILNALGYSPTWLDTDTEEVNIMPILSYLRIYLDYYFPNQYVNGSAYNTINSLIMFEDSTYDARLSSIMVALDAIWAGFYDDSIFDAAYDNPVGPNSVTSNSYAIRDVTNNSSLTQVVTNDPSSVSSPSLSTAKPSNGTPFVGSDGSSSYNSVGVITKYVLDSLKSLSLFVKRHQLAGGRLLDRLLVSRGIKISNDVQNRPYYIGQYNVEINVNDVENNSDTNLGELAGKGVASTDGPLTFEYTAPEDGIFYLVLYSKADCQLPVYNDGKNYCVDQLDFYHSEFDKLGSDLVLSQSVYTDMNGATNASIVGSNFGFLNRYWQEIQDRTRLIGDFRINSRGAASLSSYHPLRMLADTGGGLFGQVVHGINFLKNSSDLDQYRRFFYSSKGDNLILYFRFFGEVYKEKLPLGDSYDWDDDEFNRKVDVVTNGPQLN